MTTLSIDDKVIGPDQPVLIIAEIGVNHDGSVERALELVDIAADCGADAVKLQIFRADQLMHGSAQLADYQQRAGISDSPTGMLRRYELSADALARIVDHIRLNQLVPIATPFSLSDVQTLAELDIAAVKIASPDLVNHPLLQSVAKLSLPMLMSTGAATLDEVDSAVARLTDWETRIALLHCVSSYPTQPADANLRWINELAERYHVPVGYSDHTTDTLSGALAVTAGARVIERHLTHDRLAYGPDHAASSDPIDFANYVRLIRHAELMLGSPGKRLLACEMDVRSLSRQSLVLRQSIASGQPVTRHDLTTQRPGIGIPAAMVGQVIGHRALRDLDAGTMLDWSMLESASMRLSA